MMKSIFEVIEKMVSYLLDLKLFDLPLIFFYILEVVVIGYCASLVLIGFPCSVWNELAKKKISDEIESKITRIVAICIGIVLCLSLLYEVSAK